MTFGCAAMIMISGGEKKPVIHAIAITQYGDYEIRAPEGTIDGYNPIHVNLKDRYDDGYAAAKKKYEKIIAVITNEGEPVEDEDGNIIDNAIVADDTDELNDLLPRIDFTHVNSVTVDGLTGADTYFRIDKLTNESNGTTALRLVLVNKKTGETHISGTTIYSNNVKWKIESISFSGANKRSAVRIVVHGYRNGEAVNTLNKAFDGRALNVGGTSFGENGAQTAITQT